MMMPKVDRRTQGKYTMNKTLIVTMILFKLVIQRTEYTEGKISMKRETLTLNDAQNYLKNA